MPTVQIARQIDVDLNEVLSSITQLSAADLEQFLNQVTTILARRKAPSLSQRGRICCSGSTRVSRIKCGSVIAS